MGLLLLALRWAAPAHAACDAPTDSDVVTASADRAEVHFAALDVESFLADVGQARQDVTCLDEALSRSLAARLHRLDGLARFVSRDRTGAQASFAAARAIEPAYRFPTSLVPDDNPVLEAFVAIDPSTVDVAEAPSPADGYLMIDGSGTLAYRPALPLVVQRFTADGTVADTRWLAPGEAWPVYDVGRGAAPAGRRSARAPLLVAAGASAVTSGALYGLAWGSHRNWADSEAAPDQLDAYRRQTNALTVGSGAAVLVAVALGGVALAVGP